MSSLRKGVANYFLPYPQYLSDGFHIVGIQEPPAEWMHIEWMSSESSVSWRGVETQDSHCSDGLVGIFVFSYTDYQENWDFFGWFREANLGPVWCSKAGLLPRISLFLNLQACILPGGKSIALESVSPGGSPFGQLATFYLRSFFHFSLSWSYFW